MDNFSFPYPVQAGDPIKLDGLYAETALTTWSYGGINGTDGPYGVYLGKSDRPKITFSPKQRMDYIQNSYNVSTGDSYEMKVSGTKRFQTDDDRPKIILSKSRKVGQTTKMANQVVENALKGRSSIILTSTPNDKKGFFYDALDKASEKFQSVQTLNIMKDVMGLPDRVYREEVKEMAVPNLVVDIDSISKWYGYGKMDAGSLPTNSHIKYVRNPYKMSDKPSITLKYNKK